MKGMKRNLMPEKCPYWLITDAILVGESKSDVPI
jgi:hypothetical protein